MERFSVTYEVITPESAEDGDAAERGFASPHGWRHDDRTLLTLREALEVAGGPFENDGRWFSTVDAEIDYATGEHTYYSLHPPATITPSSYRRLARALGCRV